MIVANNLVEARKHAQANANQTGEQWCLFTDTSGNLRLERAANSFVGKNFEVFTPEVVTTMAKIKGDKFKQIEGAMRAVVEHWGKEVLLKKYEGRTRERMLWDIFHAAHNQLQFDNEHPHFKSGLWPRLYPYCPGFYLYSEGVNDDHVWTAVKNIATKLGL